VTDYDRIRVMWPDHLGLPRGKYLPIRLADKGTNHCVTTFALGYDRSMIPAPGGYLLDGLPDIHCGFEADEVRPGWDDPHTGVVVGHLSLNGEPYPVASRHALQRAVAQWQDLGYSPKVGIELEAYVLEPDDAGGWRSWSTPRSFVYGTGRLADLMDDIMRTAHACDLPIESINAEFDESQFEMTLEYDDALKAADDAFLFRVRLDLTFLGKPFPGRAGSGVHVNFSLVDEAGTNALADSTAPDGLSTLAKQCLAGLCEHHQGMTALCAPTVNAYRRLRPGELNGYWANWGYDHRCACNRVPNARGQGTRIENRLADGSVSIATAVATVLQAARLGVADELTCPEPLTTDGFDEVNTDISSAPDLSAALDDLEADTELVEAVGADLVANFVANKRAEWDRYQQATNGPDNSDNPEDPDTITAWELSEYLMYH